MSEIAFDPIEDLVADIKAGRMVIITDDENRENEGDLVLAAANVGLADVRPVHLFDRARPVRGAIERRVMVDDQVSVTREMHVAFDAMDGQLKRLSESGRG